MKLCKDCHWSRNKHMIASQWHCASPKNAVAGTKSLVDGKPYPVMENCHDLRLTFDGLVNSTCAVSGAWHQTTQEVYPLTLTRENRDLATKSLSKLRLEDLE